MAHISSRSDQFAYFSAQLGTRMWRGKDVLDFGGNVGNILRGRGCTIDEDRYWCIDVTAEAIEQGKASHPNAHWLFYDRYNFAFNPTGIRGLRIPDPNQRFDYILAYSIFTSIPPKDMIEAVHQLRGFLKDDGRLAFSFIDPHFRSWPGDYEGDNLQWRLERHRADGAEVDIPRLLDRARHAQWCILINDGDLYIETEDIGGYEVDSQKSCHVYYTAAFMKRLFPDATVLPPVNREMQHCCIMGRPA
jgi:SAM-dependent methyltransferase